MSSRNLAHSIIAVDIGNSRVKLFRYASDDTVRPSFLRSGQISLTFNSERDVECRSVVASIAGSPPDVGPANWFVSSVNREAEIWFREMLVALRPNDPYALLTHEDLPLEVNVESTAKVGTDRLLAAVGSDRLRNDGVPAIVVDAGSAITVDLLSADGVFQGGAILPGVSLQLRSLAQDTDALPRVLPTDATSEVAALGKTTETAIQSGVLLGVTSAVQAIAARLARTVATVPRIFVTGGDRRRFADLPNSEVVEDLVALGIYYSARHPSRVSQR